jgi:hypothetical protein
MNLFKTFTLRWWQGAIFKLGMWAAGIVAGAYWHNLFAAHLGALLACAAICLTYSTCIWAKQ